MTDSKKPKYECDVPRLCTALNKSRTILKTFREQRAHAVKQYAGSHWADGGAEKPVPVNLLALYTSIVGRNLIAKTPRVLLSTFKREHKPVVSAMQTWCNREMDDMRISDTLQRVVLDALFSLGILKVGLATPADSATHNWNLGAGAAFAERVDLDDFVFDTSARDFSEVSYIGHRFRAPLEVIRESKLYSKARKDLQASTHSDSNVEGDERIGALGRGTLSGDSEEFEDFVDLWEVYIPRKRLVLTLADDRLSGAVAPSSGGVEEALRYQDWLGPERGPYHLLAFGIVPGNAMPKGPIQDLIDLHEFVNNCYRKLMRQAERQKEMLFVQGGANEDGSRIVLGSDGEAIKVDNPDKIKVASFGGPNQPNFGMATAARDLFKEMAGNLDMMGGLSPQSKTLGQDQMLAENASRAVADLQERTVAFTASTIKALCWYWFHDPFKVMRTTHAVPGLPEISIERQVTPMDRMQTQWDDLEIKIDPYSLQSATPQSRLNAINQVMMQIIIPLMPLVQQQGIGVNINNYLKKVAEYLDMPDLADIISIQEAPEQETTGPGEHEPGMPAQTTRRYERTSMPGRTPQADNRNLVNTLMGATGEEEAGAVQ